MESAVIALRGLLAECNDEVEQQLLQGGEEGLTEGTLRRWLVARKMKLHAAAADLKAHAAWRAAWAPQGSILESEIQADLAHNKIFLQGTDKQGRAVLVLQARKHWLTESTAQQRYMCYVLDIGIRAADTAINPDSKMVGIFDLSGLSMKNLDAVGLKNVFQLLQSHYVERLSCLYMYAAPAIFWGLWKVVKPFIDPVTAKKVVFVGANEQKVLVDAVGSELLPLYLGGSADLVPIQEAAARSPALLGRHSLLQQHTPQVKAQQMLPHQIHECEHTPAVAVAAS